MTPSMRVDNHYTFLCPVAGRAERYIACMLRRHKHWRGEKIESDCATCMNSSKCPALHMLKREWNENKAIYFDAVPNRVRKLPQDIMERIERLLVSPIHAFGTGIERHRLETLMNQKLSDAVYNGVQTNTIVVGDAPSASEVERASTGHKVNTEALARLADGRTERNALRERNAASKPAKPAKDALLAAATEASADMAKALNEAIRNAGEGA